MVKKKVVKKKVVKKKVEKKFQWHCYFCGNPVLEHDKQVTIITSEHGKIVEEFFFHFNCWIDYFNKAVTKKAKEQVAEVQKKVMGLMDNPIIKGLLSSVKGTDNLFGMLQVPLTEEVGISAEEFGEIEDYRKKVRKKIQDGRKRKKRKKK